MRILNVDGRLGLITGGSTALPDDVVDVALASDGRFGPDVQSAYDEWAEFGAWASGLDAAAAPRMPVGLAALASPAPRPRQVFGIGLNYRDHVAETGLGAGGDPMVVFAKFASSVTGPYSVVELPAGSVDFEAELVVVIGRRAHKVLRETAWEYVAGLTVGQDLSERELQFRGPTPQFNLGKSYPGFAPMGPVLVTPDEFTNRDDLEITCTLNGTQMQRGRTSQFIFDIPEIIAQLSAVVTLFPGDAIFTGTPAGIGWTRNPKVRLQPGDELVTSIESIGELRPRFTS
jgi:2-keto-4-pentenoate hydratase/2-oxohepta-3-ene-1,7-dioic acid hydratase in catechol pathway